MISFVKVWALWYSGYAFVMYLNVDIKNGWYKTYIVQAHRISVKQQNIEWIICSHFPSEHLMSLTLQSSWSSSTWSVKLIELRRLLILYIYCSIWIGQLHRWDADTCPRLLVLYKENSLSNLSTCRSSIPLHTHWLNQCCFHVISMKLRWTNVE
jgi:hypothetical protein